eukprot:scaffold5527_cov54-Phaeocystis_antarctica.AAC.1
MRSMRVISLTSWRPVLTLTAAILALAPSSASRSPHAAVRTTLDKAGALTRRNRAPVWGAPRRHERARWWDGGGGQRSASTTTAEGARGPCKRYTNMSAFAGVKKTALRFVTSGCPGALLGREVAQSQRLTGQKETTSDCDYVEDEDGDGDGSARGGRLGASFRPHDDGDLDE